METTEVRDTSGAGASDATEIERELAEVHSLLTENRVEQARALTRDLAARFPESEAAQRYARVLAPPVARSVPGIKAQPRDQERAWLREHAREYPGCWLAVLGDRLLAADPDAQVVLLRLRELPEGEQAVLFYQSSPSV